LLGAEGINVLFGIPDPGFTHMAMTAEKRGWSVVAPHHEQGGAFMADAWSRMTGKPAVCFGTQGPGVANLAGAWPLSTATPARPFGTQGPRVAYLTAAMICAAKENAPTLFFGGQRSRV